MIIHVGYIPYLNMVPFHHEFGPGPLESDGRYYEFHKMSPHALGLEAEKGIIDAGALSLVDSLRLADRYEPIGSFGIGTKRFAQSVLLFSRRPLSELQGECAVTDETATSFRLLQILLRVRHGRARIQYGRIASSVLFDGSAESLLLIGDEAIRAKQEGIKGLPVVTDLGEEWFQWQGVPFVFARWCVRQALRQEVKDHLEQFLHASLAAHHERSLSFAQSQAPQGTMSALDIINYWNGFVYELTPAHRHSVDLFSELLEKAYV